MNKLFFDANTTDAMKWIIVCLVCLRQLSIKTEHKHARENFSSFFDYIYYILSNLGPNMQIVFEDNHTPMLVILGNFGSR